MGKVIAVDFDGTLCKAAWPNIGSANRAAIQELIRRRQQGDKIILWTCRCGELLDAAVAWCSEFGLYFDAINDNLPEHIERYNNNSRKVWADEYWDDKALRVAKL